MKKKLPPDHPAAIAEKAAKMPFKPNTRIDISSYEKAIVTLKERGYSFGEIADWLTKELNGPVKRGQVYYVYQMYLAEREQDFQDAWIRGETKERPNINLSEEEAERKAQEEDQVRRKKKP